MAARAIWVLVFAVMAAAFSNEALAQNSTSPAEEEAVEVELRNDPLVLAYRLAPVIAIVAGFVGFIIWKQKVSRSRQP